MSPLRAPRIAPSTSSGATNCLPESWLYGLADVLRQAEVRRAFWNGEYRETGWAGFSLHLSGQDPAERLWHLTDWPWAPPGTMEKEGDSPSRPPRSDALGADLPHFAALDADGRLPGGGNLEPSQHRAPPPAAGLRPRCSSSAAPQPAGLSKSGTGFQPVPLREAPRFTEAVGPAWLSLHFARALLAAETAWRFPNYIAYFSGIVRPATAYRHLVDSSLDWGQELPAVSRYIQQHPTEAPFYFSYFGVWVALGTMACRRACFIPTAALTCAAARICFQRTPRKRGFPPAPT